MLIALWRSGETVLSPEARALPECATQELRGLVGRRRQPSIAASTAECNRLPRATKRKWPSA